MPYDKEVNPGIKILDTKDFTSVTPLKRPEEKSLYTHLYRASFQGIEEVVVKQFTSSLADPQHDGVAEANALYLLQGVPCVPTLYGVIMNTTPLGLYWGRGLRGEIIETRAIVEELAGGDLLRDSKIYRDPRLIAEYYRDTYRNAENTYRDTEKRKTLFQKIFQKTSQKTSQKTEITGKNIRAEVGSQIANHLRGCLERGLVDPDLSPHEVFLQVNPDRTLGLLKVDYGMMEHPDEMGESGYDSVMQALIGMIPEVGHSKTSFIFDKGDDSRRRSIDNLKTKSARFRTDGLPTLADLLGSYVEKEFYRNDAETFLRFLGIWERAMKEHGEFLIDQEDIRQRKTEEFKKMDLYDAVMNIGESPSKLDIWERVRADNNPLITAIMYDQDAKLHEGTWSTSNDKMNAYKNFRLFEEQVFEEQLFGKQEEPDRGMSTAYATTVFGGAFLTPEQIQEELGNMDLFSALLRADETNNPEITSSLEGRVKASHDSLIREVWNALKDKNSKYLDDRASAGKVLSFYREYADPKKLEEAIWDLSGGIDDLKEVTYESLLRILGAENATSWRLPEGYPHDEHAIFTLYNRLGHLATYFGHETGDVLLDAAYWDMLDKIKVKKGMNSDSETVASRLERFGEENGLGSEMRDAYVRGLDPVGKLYDDILYMHDRVETEPYEFNTREAIRPFQDLQNRASELGEPLLLAMVMDLYPKSSEKSGGGNIFPGRTSRVIRSLQEFEKREGLDDEISRAYSESMYGNQAGEEWERANNTASRI